MPDPSGLGRVDMLTSPVAAARAAIATGAWVKSKRMYLIRRSVGAQALFLPIRRRIVKKKKKSAGATTMRYYTVHQQQQVLQQQQQVSNRTLVARTAIVEGRGVGASPWDPWWQMPH